MDGIDFKSNRKEIPNIPKLNLEKSNEKVTDFNYNFWRF